MRILFTPVFFLLCLLFSAFAAPIATWEDPPPPYSQHDNTSPRVAPVNSPVVPVNDPPPPYSQHDNTSPQVGPVKSPVVPVTETVPQVSGQLVVDLILHRGPHRFVTSIPLKSAATLRNAVEILLPWFIPMLRWRKYKELVTLPAQELSFQVNNLTCSSVEFEYEPKPGPKEYYVVEVKFPGREDLNDRWHLLIYFEAKKLDQQSSMSLQPKNAVELEGYVLLRDTWEPYGEWIYRTDSASTKNSHDPTIQPKWHNYGLTNFESGNYDFRLTSKTPKNTQTKFNLKGLKWEQNTTPIQTRRARPVNRAREFLFRETTPKKCCIQAATERVKKAFGRVDTAVLEAYSLESRAAQDTRFEKKQPSGRNDKVASVWGARTQRLGFKLALIYPDSTFVPHEPYIKEVSEHGISLLAPSFVCL
ncbi:hypothetical protein EV360DRAFT_67302 [Lentinula raphanica]|nr:hypothetical protein EV360DRAFT_67302 [Lentinula raphanica]